MARRADPTALTDGAWRMLERLMPPATSGGRPRRVEIREIVNALRYLLRSGGAGRLSPHAFPPWPTVAASYRRREADGTWERSAHAWRRDLRAAVGRRPEPSAAVLERQPVTTTETGGRAALTPASRPPAASGPPWSTPQGCGRRWSCIRPTCRRARGRSWLLTKAKTTGRAFGKIWVARGEQQGCVAWAQAELGYPREVVARPPGRNGCAVSPRRWGGERRFAWIGRSRRLRKDDEALTAASEAMIGTAFGTTMLRRLVKRRASKTRFRMKWLTPGGNCGGRSGGQG